MTREQYKKATELMAKIKDAQLSYKTWSEATDFQTDMVQVKTPDGVKSVYVAVPFEELKKVAMERLDKEFEKLKVQFGEL